MWFMRRVASTNLKEELLGADFQGFLFGGFVVLDCMRKDLKYMKQTDYLFLAYIGHKRVDFVSLFNQPREDA